MSTDMKPQKETVLSVKYGSKGGPRIRDEALTTITPGELGGALGIILTHDYDLGDHESAEELTGDKSEGEYAQVQAQLLLDLNPSLPLDAHHLLWAVIDALDLRFSDYSPRIFINRDMTPEEHEDFQRQIDRLPGAPALRRLLSCWNAEIVVRADEPYKTYVGLTDMSGLKTARRPGLVSRLLTFLGKIARYFQVKGNPL